MRVLYLTLGILISDQISKSLIRGISIPALGLSLPGMALGASKPVLGDFLRFTYIENPGMAFGVTIGPKMMFSLISLIASIVIIVYLYRIRQENLTTRLSLACILGGALGNLVDRMFYGIWYQGTGLFEGRVVDFIDVKIFPITLFGHQMTRFWIFNIADAAVTVGVIALILFFPHPPKQQSAPAPRPEG